MRKAAAVICLGFLAFVYVAPSFADSISCNDDSTVSIRNELLADKKTRDLYRTTLSGDKSSPLKLATEIAKSKPNYVMCINRLGAENGDPVSQYNYATRLLESDDEATKARGIFWLKKAAAADLKIAKSLLSEHQASSTK